MSSRKSLYCFDTSSYIRAWHEAYPPDVVETFWERLDDAISEGIVISPDEVLQEMKKRSEDLHRWLKARDSCIVEIDDPLQQAVTKLLAANPEMAKNRKGASSADAWVIGLAHIRGAIVVSEETIVDSEKKPKIPGVCKRENIPCMKLLEFMRTQKWKI